MVGGTRNGSRLYAEAKTLMPIYDRREFRSAAEFREALADSRTVYVGNVEPSTTEEQLYGYFRACGDIRRIIVGLQAALRTPCGFAFVEFYTPHAAACAVALCNGATPPFAAAHPQNARAAPGTISVNQDPGFTPGRQYGRSRSAAIPAPAGTPGRSRHALPGRSPYRGRSSPFGATKRVAPATGPAEPPVLVPPSHPLPSSLDSVGAAVEPETKRVHTDSNDA